MPLLPELTLSAGDGDDELAPLGSLGSLELPEQDEAMQDTLQQHLPGQTAAAAAAVPGCSVSSPFNSTHSSSHTLFFPAKRPSGSKTSSSSGASSAAREGRPGKLFTVDTSVGWCVLEPMETNPKAPAAAAAAAVAAPSRGAGVQGQHKRSRWAAWMQGMCQVSIACSLLLERA
jgi:hypothetical protein